MFGVGVGVLFVYLVVGVWFVGFDGVVGVVYCCMDYG